MGGLDLEGTRIVFFIQMPKSWSQKKKDKMRGCPHRQKPDLTNLIKAAEDALYVNGRDDSIISSYAGLSKVWATKPSIQVTI